MEKTKLGLSVSLAGAAVYLLYQFGGYTPALLLVGYILLCETNTGLKKTALSATLIALGYSLVNYVIYLLPNALGVLTSLLEIFGVYTELYIIDRIFNWLSSVVGFLKGLLMVFLAAMSLLNKPVELPFVKKIINED